MAGLGRKTFTAGEVLSAANVQGYLQDQAVMVFAGTAARSSAIATASAGMVTFNSTTEQLEVYTHSTWVGLNYSTIMNGTVAAYTATAADANQTFVLSSGSAQSFVVPDLFDIGERVDIIREGAGTVSITAGTGVTSWAGIGTAGTAVAFKITQQYGAASVQKIAANTYRVIGAIS